MTLLDITLTNGWAIAIGIGIALIIFSLISTNKDLQKQKDNFFKKSADTEKQLQIDKNESLSKLKEQSLIFQKKEAELKVTYQTWAIGELERFKKLETEKIQKEAESQSLKAASVLLQKWKIENEAKIRQDAINRSYSVNLGKITEHLVPFHQSFLSQFNPKDARFIGSPIDLIVFDGYADKKDEIQIYIVEIKTGNSKLTEIQKKIKEAVLNGNIRWAEINPANTSQTILLNPNKIESEPINQLALDFDDADNVAKLFATVQPQNGETRDDLIERIAKTIEEAGKLADEEGCSVETAIKRKIEDYKILFTSNDNREFFIREIARTLEFE